MKHRWKAIFQYPDLQNLKSLQSATDRLTMAANSEAGCEQSNSKYTRAKKVEIHHEIANGQGKHESRKQ